jgi:O-6-methylguanine DNA methyltransferase
LAVLELAKTELCEYLAGTRCTFSVPLDVEGSEFFRRVWDALLSVPYGRTVTYSTLAAEARRPRAFRAAGAACALNPAPLIIPCHRAVGSDGSLTGFGGGLAMKEALLRLEGAVGRKES